jgi:hypothetical protein
MPVPAAALIAGGSALASGIQAAKQKKAADKIKVGTEVISEEQKKALAMLKAKQGQGFAGKDELKIDADVTTANVLGQSGPGDRTALLGEAMRTGSDTAAKISTLDAQAKEDNNEALIAGTLEMGKDKQEIERRKIAAAAAAKAALLASSQANVSNAATAAAGAVDTLSANKANQTA